MRTSWALCNKFTTMIWRKQLGSRASIWLCPGWASRAPSASLAISATSERPNSKSSTKKTTSSCDLKIFLFSKPLHSLCAGLKSNNCMCAHHIYNIMRDFFPTRAQKWPGARRREGRKGALYCYINRTKWDVSFQFWPQTQLYFERLSVASQVE